MVLDWWIYEWMIKKIVIKAMKGGKNLNVTALINIKINPSLDLKGKEKSFNR